VVTISHIVFSTLFSQYINDSIVRTFGDSGKDVQMIFFFIYMKIFNFAFTTLIKKAMEKAIENGDRIEGEISLLRYYMVFKFSNVLGSFFSISERNSTFYLSLMFYMNDEL
jgi:hypothetical protein